MVWNQAQYNRHSCWPSSYRLEMQDFDRMSTAIHVGCLLLYLLKLKSLPNNHCCNKLTITDCTHKQLHIQLCAAMINTTHKNPNLHDLQLHFSQA